jgi:AcrR family transcriptional regulator
MWQGVLVATTLRRIGSTDSKTRLQLVDAAERLMLEEGYAAVTSRRVGQKAGLKPQLVHYYFRTMDDLFIEVFHRRAEENLTRIERTIAEGPSLRALWAFNNTLGGALFSIEFAALANHRKAIRAEVARYAERFRAVQLAALTSALSAAGIDEAQMPPIAGLLLMTGLGQILGIEQLLGVTAGHAETVAFINGSIARMEQTRVR